MKNNGQVQTTEKKAVKNVVTQDKIRRKVILFSAVGVVLVLLVAIIIGMTVFGGDDRKLQEQLDLGAKYLEEMDYEQALVAFNAALSIEPQNVDAYLGIVEVYIRTNEFESALEYARKGYEITRDERLKEKIDMIESGNIFATNGWNMKMSGYDGDGNLIFWHEYTYNLKGQQASVTKYNAAGEREQYLELAYDEKGRRLIGYDYGIPEGDLSKCVREYDGSNYRITWYEGISDVVRHYAEVEADSDGKELKSTGYGKDGSVWGITAYEYDGEGRMIKEVSYDGNNELTYCDIFTYDEDGKRLQQQCYDSNNELMWYTEYIYDDEENWIGYRDYDANGVLQSEQIAQ